MLMKENQTNHRAAYVAPAVEIIEMEMEQSVMTGSGESLTGVQMGKSSTRRTPYTAARSNDLEEMIEDILTVEQ